MSFQSVWRIFENNFSLSLPLCNPPFLLELDWGDGSLPETVVPNMDTNSNHSAIVHVYAIANNYTVQILGQFPGFECACCNGCCSHLTEISGWGGLIVENTSQGVLSGCTNLLRIPDLQPDFQAGANLDYFFEGCSSLDVALNWNLVNITSVRGMFAHAWKFNSALHFLNTHNIKDMSLMFFDAVSFNQPLLRWETSNVTTMEKMFFGALAFNQMLDFNTENVISMRLMFGIENASITASSSGSVSSLSATGGTFNQQFFFNTRSVRDFSGFMMGQILFNQPLIFDTSNVLSMSEMLYNCISFNSVLQFSTTSLVTNMSNMLRNAVVFNHTLEFFNTVNVVDMEDMFLDAQAFEQNLSSWNISNTVKCSNFCHHCVLPKFKLCQPCESGYSLLLPSGQSVCNCPSDLKRAHTPPAASHPVRYCELIISPTASNQPFAPTPLMDIPQASRDMVDNIIYGVLGVCLLTLIVCTAVYVYRLHFYKKVGVGETTIDVEL